MSTELKACPFCGNTELELASLGDDDWFVECEKNYVKGYGCGMSLHAIHPTREAAIAAWNTRAKTVEAATLHMAVDRLGGTVEGQPTQPFNFLQRIDQLVSKEKAFTEMYEALKFGLGFVEDELECRKTSFLPDDGEDFKRYIKPAQDLVETIEGALAAAEGVR